LEEVGMHEHQKMAGQQFFYYIDVHSFKKNSRNLQVSPS